MPSKKKVAQNTSTRSRSEARRLPPRSRARPFETQAALQEAVVAEAERVLSAITGRRQTRFSAETMGRVREQALAIERGEQCVRDRLAALADALDALALPVDGDGPLAQWSRREAPRLTRLVREEMRFPFLRPRGIRVIGPDTVLVALVDQVFRDRRDVLGLGREPSPRELALMAILRGYFPAVEITRTTPLASLTVGSMLKRATTSAKKALRNAGYLLKAQ